MTQRTIFRQSLGLDVSKDHLQACIAQQDSEKRFRILATRKFGNNANGLKQLEVWLRKFSKEGVDLHILMEATGVYYEEAAYFFYERGYRLCVALPNKTKAYAKSLPHKSKTDAVDSQMLAQMALERDMPEWNPLSKIMLKVKRLCRERVELLQLKTVSSNRLHARNHAHQPDAGGKKRTKELLKFLQKQIKDVERAIEQAISADEDLRQKVEILCSIKGVGLLTAATIIGETNGFALFSSKGQLVCYAGYDVVENQSGSSLNGKTRISKKGNAAIRRALHYPALTTIKHDPNLRNLYDRVFDKSKIKMKAAVAVQRKLLVLMYTLYKKHEIYDLNYHNATQTSQRIVNENRQEHQSVPA